MRHATMMAMALLAGTVAVRAEEFRVLAWNVESNRPGQPPVSDAAAIGGQLTELLRAPATRAQVIALSEVEPKTVWTYRAAVAEGLGGEVDFVTSASGGYADADSLMLVVDAKRFRIDEVIELHRYAGIRANFTVEDETSSEHGSVRGRSPLIARLHDLSSGDNFWVIVNHLARGENDLRTDQARALRRWAADRSEPVIAAGDFNFDYEFSSAKGNPAFDAMLAAGLVEEVRNLRERYPALAPALPSMRCVGYRQVWEMQDGLLPVKELRDRGVFATRQLAKRQITWLRGFSDITRIDCLSASFRQQALTIAQQFIEETRA